MEEGPSSPPLKLDSHILHPLSLFPSEGSVHNVNLDATYTYYMIQGLQPGTEYTVTINPVFGDIEGPVVSRKATTCKYPRAGK